MKPTFEEFKKACPEVDDRLIEEHLSRLDKRYFKRFAKKDLFRHLKGLSSLSNEHPVEVIVEKKRDGDSHCTILAFDYPYEFSLITGVLAGMGFSIHTGDVFTYERIGKLGERTKKRTGGPALEERIRGRRRIIDHFFGILDTTLSMKDWSVKFRERIDDVIKTLEAGDELSILKAKEKVSEWVVGRLSSFEEGSNPVLYPVQIKIEEEGGMHNRLSVVSEDTPAFLYALSNALSLQDIYIEHVRIRTIQGRVEDQIDLVGSNGKAIIDPDIIDRIKLTTLLTKQFTYFLSIAPDPYTALTRFENMLGDILRLPDQGQWLSILTNPKTMKDLARLLGASDFLWEDFIRLQYESLLPILGPGIEGRRFSEPIETIDERLDQAVEEAASLEDQQEKLNWFKDREIFLIDLDHILNPDVNFRTLSRRLTRLAECILDKSTKLLYDSLSEKFGIPRSVAGLPAEYAILGMGKLGGGALGYASDIELLLVYSDNGRTDGEKSIENSEFFSLLVKESVKFIRTKREGIFNVDLRLRPYGDAGPLACSFENFCRYYGRGGQAYSFERLALVRLRAVGGNLDFGARLERIRDELIYKEAQIDLKELRNLREKQLGEKTRKDELNAKFSPGGLVDLEYSVQILQVIYGRENETLRTPYIHEALGALVEAGVLVSGEGARLNSAYDFLRILINGMRMLRGSAKDLFLPPIDSNEFAHLARRMGYEGGGGLAPAQQLHMDFETNTAEIRVFAERHFGQESLTDSRAGTVVDLILSDSLPDQAVRQILEKSRFRDMDRAYVNLKGLAGKGPRRDIFARLALLALDLLKRRADPDRALNNWERYIRSQASPEFHYNLLLSQPMRLEILLSIFSESQFLADTLIRNPGFLDWVMIPDILHNSRNRKEIEEELRNAFRGCGDHSEWLNKLRRLRRREILRIGIRDICLGVSTSDVMNELSTVAEAFVQIVLERIGENIMAAGKNPGEPDELKKMFCILAFGKLGGRELNYSSDIDLLGIWDDSVVNLNNSGQRYYEYKDYFIQVMEMVTSDLSNHMEEGYAYRVDLRLRPFGREGELVPTLSGIIDYYKKHASLWEIQAALKLRPIAGSLRLGYDFLERLSLILVEKRGKKRVVSSIERMRNMAMGMTSGQKTDGPGTTLDVKNGLGGLRDTEFLVQGLQLIHAPENRGIIEGNTLGAINLLKVNGIIPEEAADQLKEDYIFLRKIEHYLQILDDRQIHVLPRDSYELEALAKRILGVDSSSALFMKDVIECLERIRNTYVQYLLENV